MPGEEATEIVTRYRYNGLGFRIMKQDDADATLEASERFYFAYDPQWQVARWLPGDALMIYCSHFAEPIGGGGGLIRWRLLDDLAEPDQ